ncbi:hypothetical protein F5883DRAFT_139054 [Diaporthe sp. PMI_573]|nr:hypothetical protein F5883DRAFT_139054 [Diaporthaceae sp. PMI_573]
MLSTWLLPSWSRPCSSRSCHSCKPAIRTWAVPPPRDIERRRSSLVGPCLSVIGISATSVSGSTPACPACLITRHTSHSVAGRMPRTPPSSPLQPKENTPNSPIVYSVAAPARLLLDLSERDRDRVDAWLSPGSIEIPSDEITKPPAETADEVTRIEGRKRVPSFLSDPLPIWFDSIRRAKRNLDLNSTPNLVLDLGWLGKDQGSSTAVQTKTWKAGPASPVGAEHTTASAQRQRVKRPSSHAARDILPRSTRPPFPPPKGKGRGGNTCTTWYCVVWPGGKFIVGRPSARGRGRLVIHI